MENGTKQKKIWHPFHSGKIAGNSWMLFKDKNE
jgi:hypothetical protein